MTKVPPWGDPLDLSLHRNIDLSLNEIDRFGNENQRMGCCIKNFRMRGNISSCASSKT